ncbi:MAG: hypothetical protein H0X40_15045 [Chthoniobacterales bacterium]|nr:hypothetical protein [Chthoniobacterales bacterium]
MPSTFRYGFYAGLLCAFVFGIYLFLLWGAESQVRLHAEHLLHQVERRAWSNVGGFVAADYRDDWGDDREKLLNRLRTVGRYFFSLTITASEARTQISPAAATWQARIQMNGTGEAAAEINSRVNSLTTPFVLHWRHESWRPWDWKLSRVENKSLEIPEGEF